MTDELLRALGKRQAEPPPGLGDDPEEARADEVAALLQPFEGEERAALLDGVLDQLDQLDREPAGAEAEPTGAEAEAAPPPVELASRRRSSWPWLGVVTAMAAAVLLWLGLRRPDATTADGALPPYSATRLDGGTATMRSKAADPSSSITLAPEASIDWVLTPRSPVRTPVGAVILASTPGQPAQLVRPAALEVTAEGVVRLSGPLSEVLPLPAGTWSLTVLVGAPETLPRTAAEAEAGAVRAWSRVSFEVKITAAP